MSNKFDRVELARYYDDIERCRWCNSYGADAMHHCISVGRPHTGSILNATPLHNGTCHLQIHGKLMQREQQEKFILGNIIHLANQGYKFKDQDKKFLVFHNLEHILKKVLQK